MRKNELMSENDVKSMLGISDFRSISKDQIIQFVSSMHNMDKEVAIKCIEQFPEFEKFSNNALQFLTDASNTIINDNKSSRKDVVLQNQQILDSLSKILEKEDISPEEQEFVINAMIDVANSTAAIHKNNNEFLKNIFSKLTTVAAVAITIGGALLGVKFIDKKD